MRVCAMQPAFIPPASYFRLFAASDAFVMLDDVQFDRRWYTHRQKLTKRNGEKDWLTLPIKKSPRDTTMIKDLEWRDKAKEDWKLQLKKFPILDDCRTTFLSIGVFLAPCISSPLRLLEISLRLSCEKLDTLALAYRSSDIEIDSSLRAQDRILAICKKLGATEYINSPGGRHLYDEEAFAKEGIKLTFLPEWKGSYDSIIERLATEPLEKIREEIYDGI